MIPLERPLGGCRHISEENTNHNIRPMRVGSVCAAALHGMAWHTSSPERDPVIVARSGQLNVFHFPNSQVCANFGTGMRCCLSATGIILASQLRADIADEHPMLDGCESGLRRSGWMICWRGLSHFLISSRDMDGLNSRRSSKLLTKYEVLLDGGRRPISCQAQWRRRGFPHSD